MNKEQNGVTVAEQPYTHRYKIRGRMTTQYGSAISTTIVKAVKEYCEREGITQASFLESALMNELKLNGQSVD